MQRVYGAESVFVLRLDRIPLICARLSLNSGLRPKKSQKKRFGTIKLNAAFRARDPHTFKENGLHANHDAVQEISATAVSPQKSRTNRPLFSRGNTSENRLHSSHGI